MLDMRSKNDECGCGGAGAALPPLPMFQPEPDNAPCCGAPPGPPSSPDERPGYRLCPFVERFVETPQGMVPRVKTRLGVGDWLGALGARLGISRDRYRIAPGLYAVGEAGPEAPVLVTANYKLSFDALRRQLAGVAAWILVLDTRGVNVWCAAGKKTLSTAEVIRQVERTSLAQVVSHRELILPQLAAPGVAGHQVRKGCGFSVIWGPIKACDLKPYLGAGRETTEAMRALTFTLAERVVLIPVEISLILTPSLWVVLAICALSAVGPHWSWVMSWHRALHLGVAYGVGVLSGAVAVPILLPWLPWRSFYLKGALAGLVGGLLAVLGLKVLGWPALAMVLVSMAVSSYAAMNFTGATPYASPSGVEKEMRQGIPAQMVALVVALVLWVGGPFWF